MNTLPKISIIIPVYNVEEYITECLQSVMRQTYKGEIECILVDDCGKDNSISIAEQLIADYTGTIAFRILRHEHNRGLSAARNTGTDVATGEYIYYLDSDDYVTDDCIEKLIEPLEKKKYDMVIGDYQMFGDRQDATLLLEPRNEICGNDAIFESYADRQIYVMAWNKLCKLAFLKDNNISFLEGQLHEDDMWTYKIMCKINNIYIIHRNIYMYRMRPMSIMNDISKIKMRLNSYYETLRYIQENPYQQEESYEKCYLWYWGRCLHMALNEYRIPFYEQYIKTRKTCPYNPWSHFVHRRITLRMFKAKFHFALPAKLGYWYLQLRDKINTYRRRK